MQYFIIKLLFHCGMLHQCIMSLSCDTSYKEYRVLIHYSYNSVVYNNTGLCDARVQWKWWYLNLTAQFPSLSMFYPQIAQLSERNSKMSKSNYSGHNLSRNKTVERPPSSTLR